MTLKKTRKNSFITPSNKFIFTLSLVLHYGHTTAQRNLYLQLIWKESQWCVTAALLVHEHTPPGELEGVTITLFKHVLSLSNLSWYFLTSVCPTLHLALRREGLSALAFWMLAESPQSPVTPAWTHYTLHRHRLLRPSKIDIYRSKCSPAIVTQSV